MTQVEIMVAQSGAVLRTLLPVLCSLVASRRESGDTRFLCLRVLAELLQMFLAEPRLYAVQVKGLE